MNTSINFNEVRKLAAQVAKSRPILGCLRIEGGRAMWTDSIYLVAMDGYSKSQNITVSLSDYSIKTDDYPALERFIDAPFESVSHTTAIEDDKVVYEFERSDGRVTFIDQEILAQLSKLIANKKFTMCVSEIDMNESRMMGRITVDQNTKLYFMLKIRNK